MLKCALFVIMQQLAYINGFPINMQSIEILLEIFCSWINSDLLALDKCLLIKFYFDPWRQIDSSDADLPDEKMLEHSYSAIEDDTFQVSMIALHGSACSADLDYLHSSTPKVSTFIS